jgi:predicted enzyme involved in methoxymalonyl-ACP biosynthesis
MPFFFPLIRQKHEINLKEERKLKMANQHKLNKLKPRHSAVSRSLTLEKKTILTAIKARRVHDPKGGCALLNDGTVKFIRTKEELQQLRWK